MESISRHNNCLINGEWLIKMVIIIIAASNGFRSPLGAFLDNFKEYFEANYLLASARHLKFEFHTLLAIRWGFLGWFILIKITVKNPKLLPHSM